jgi:hypothetical protein
MRKQQHPSRGANSILIENIALIGPTLPSRGSSTQRKHGRRILPAFSSNTYISWKRTQQALERELKSGWILYV